MSLASPGGLGPAAPGRVRVLEDRLINQIAAGEVVERPASVLKELVENAIDSGARHLRVSLRGGGRELVQVEDDGCGMDKQDAMLCVERHATSKIRAADDLAAIRTLGFRGEALPSIAAVSRFELTTRRADLGSGTAVIIDGGRLVEVREAGSPPGTRVSVRSLFFNLPARRKFLRTEATELQHCQDTLLSQVLMREELGVELFHEGRPLLRAQPGEPLLTRVEALLGPSVRGLVPVQVRSEEVPGGLVLTGLASPPDLHLASARGSLWLHVNGRTVRDPQLRRAVLDAYRGLVPRGRYPVVVLDLRIEPSQVDVNVHPAKSEVRLRDAQLVLRSITEGLREALSERGIRASAMSPPRGMRSPSLEIERVQERLPGLQPPAPPAPPAPPPAPLPRPEPSRVQPARPEPPPPDLAWDSGAGPPQPARALGLRWIGTFGEAWLVCEHEDELILVDLVQARAQRVRRAMAERPPPRPLLAPRTVELEPALAEAVGPRLPELLPLGLELEPFGGGTVCLRALSAPLAAADAPTLVRAACARLQEGLPAERIADRLARLVAESPVPLSPYEQKGLLEGLDLDEPGLALRMPAEELRRRLSRRGG